MWKGDSGVKAGLFERQNAKLTVLQQDTYAQTAEWQFHLKKM
jgi:hypothetical protein